MTNFWVKITIILSVLAKTFFYTCYIFMIFVALKNGR